MSCRACGRRGRGTGTVGDGLGWNFPLTIILAYFIICRTKFSTLRISAWTWRQHGSAEKERFVNELQRNKASLPRFLDVVALLWRGEGAVAWTKGVSRGFTEMRHHLDTSTVIYATAIPQDR